jgi:hypothetical protein
MQTIPTMLVKHYHHLMEESSEPFGSLHLPLKPRIVGTR